MPIRLLLAALLALGALAAPAGAATRDQIIRDCADDGRLQGDYSPGELRDARRNMPSDVAEYTDCADVLRRAELPDSAPSGSASSGGPGGGLGPGGGPILQTPMDDAERQALADAASGGGAAVAVDGAKILPGSAGVSPEGRGNGIPGTLLAALIAIALLALAFAVPALRRLNWPRLPHWAR